MHEGSIWLKLLFPQFRNFFRALIAPTGCANSSPLLFAYLPVLKDRSDIVQWERPLRSILGARSPRKGITLILGLCMSYIATLVLGWMHQWCDHWFPGLTLLILFYFCSSLQMCLGVRIVIGTWLSAEPSPENDLDNNMIRSLCECKLCAWITEHWTLW